LAKVHTSQTQAGGSGIVKIGHRGSSAFTNYVAQSVRDYKFELQRQNPTELVVDIFSKWGNEPSRSSTEYG